jgi:methyltransferase (TIGR00027 family)
MWLAFFFCNGKIGPFIFTRKIMPKEKRTVIDTAKDVLAVKYVTSQPGFWQQQGCGTREKPLSNLKVAKLFLNEEEIEKATNHPGLANIKTSSVRERAINKAMNQLIKTHGYRQVLILGSGFDGRAVKKSHAMQKERKHKATYEKVKFWEVDNIKILEEKEKKLKEHGLDKNATYIAADYTSTDFADMLLEQKFDSELPTCIILEGNLMYLNKEQISQLFSQLKESLSQFVITFDFFPQSIIDFIKQKARENSNESLWKSGIDDIEAFAKAHDMQLIINQDIASLSKIYQVDSNPVPGAEQYQICSLNYHALDLTLDYTPRFS